MHPVRYGVSVPSRSLPLPDAVELAVAAEVWGFKEAWTDEVDTVDGLTPLAWIASRTRSQVVGVGVVPAMTRPAALLAMSASALHLLSDGRFVLGLGASTPNVVDGWMGLRYDSPKATLEETIELLRLMFTGERVEYPGEYARTDGFRLRSGPCEVPLYIGSHGTQTLAMAGAIADGVVLGNVAARWIPDVLASVRSGAESAERDIDEIDVVCRVVVGVDEDRDELDLDFRRTIVSYASSDAYRSFFARMGWAETMDEVSRAWARRDGAAAVSAVPSELVGELFVVGTATECAVQLRRFVDAGVRAVLVHPTSSATEPDERASRMQDALRQLGVALAELAPAGNELEDR